MTDTTALLVGAFLGTVGAWLIIAVSCWVWDLIWGPRTHVPAAHIVKAMERTGDLVRTAQGGSPQTAPDHDKGR